MNLQTTQTTYTRQRCGFERWKVSGRIYDHLQRVGMNGQTIADSLGTTRQWVSQTITGRNNSPRVLDALREAGVPEKYLFDPRRVEIGAARREAA